MHWKLFTSTWYCCWKWRYSLTAVWVWQMNPLWHSWGFNVSYQRQQIYVTVLRWQLWNLGGEMTAAVFKRGADCCHSAGGDEVCPCTCFRPLYSRPGANENNAIGSLSHCCIPTFIELKVSSVLLFWGFNTKWLHSVASASLCSACV